METDYFDPANFIKTLQPDSGELASQFISLISITVMSLLFGIKTYNVQFKYLSYSRWLILALYLMSWAFTTAATIFVSTNNAISCLAFFQRWLAIYFILGQKLLIEKVWVLSASRQKRWNTMSYRFHVMLMTPYIAIFTLMIVFHISELQHDGVCIIGLQPIASIPLLMYDFIFNLYMTILFVKPLLNVGKGIRIDWKASRLHDVAKRTLVASIVALLVSFANVLALAILNGRERGVLCLTCCTVDVTINVVTVHWVTTNRASKTSKDYNNTQTNANSGTHRNQSSADVDHAVNNGDIDEYQAKIHHFNHLYSMPQPSEIAVPSYEDSNYYNNVINSRTPHNKTQMLEEDMASERTSRPSSIQESHSSRKSLTKK